MKITSLLPTFLLASFFLSASSLGDGGNKDDATTNAHRMDKKKKRHLQSSVRGSRALSDDGVPYNEGNVGGGGGSYGGGPVGGVGDVGGNVGGNVAGGGGVVVEPVGTRRPDGSIVVEGGIVIPPDLRPTDHSNNPGRFEGLRGGYYGGNIIGVGGSRSGGMMGMSGGSRYGGNIYYGGYYAGNIGGRRSGGMMGGGGSKYGGVAGNRYNYNYAGNRAGVGGGPGGGYYYVGNIGSGSGGMMGMSGGGRYNYISNRPYNPNYNGYTGNLAYSGNLGGNVGKGVPNTTP